MIFMGVDFTCVHEATTAITSSISPVTPNIDSYTLYHQYKLSWVTRTSLLLIFTIIFHAFPTIVSYHFEYRDVPIALVNFDQQ